MSKNTTSDILLAGAFAAFTVDLLVYPLDTLKTRIQSPDYRRLFIDKASGSVNKQALFRGLYQGLGTVVIATLPSSGAFFSTYEGVKSIVKNNNVNGFLPTPIIHSFASASAELVSCAILTPAEVIKQNAQMVSRTSSKSSSATVQTLRKFKRNPLGLWRGYSALAGRNLPFTALQFPMFEKLKEVLTARRKRQTGRLETNVLEHGIITGLAAGSAGSVAAVVTTPVDVVKTRIMLAAATSAEQPSTEKTDTHARQQHAKKGQVADALGSVVGRSKNTKGSLEIAKEIVAAQGWRGLMRGGALRAVWTFLGSGLYLAVYEGGRLHLEKRRSAESEVT